jgi:hypothetical protein
MIFYLGEDLIELPEDLVRKHEEGRLLGIIERMIRTKYP